MLTMACYCPEPPELDEPPAEDFLDEDVPDRLPDRLLPPALLYPPLRYPLRFVLSAGSMVKLLAMVTVFSRAVSPPTNVLMPSRKSVYPAFPLFFL